MKNMTKKTVDYDVGQRIREVRLAAGLRLEDIAYELSLSTSQYQKYEVGSARITAEQLWSVAVYFDKPIDHFFGARKKVKNKKDSKVDRGRSKLMRTYDKIQNPEHREILLDIAKQFSGR